MQNLIVDKAVFEWFSLVRGSNLPIGRPTLKKEVLELVKSSYCSTFAHDS